MPGRVLVTGASGFVGTAVIEELLARNYAVIAMVNRHPLKVGSGLVQSIQADLFDGAAIESAIKGCDAVLHLVGIIMERPARRITFQRIHLEGAMRVIDAARRNGVRRFVHMSALGTRPGAVSNYHKTKFAAEEYLRASGLEWTIFRPSLIHGPRGEFMQMESKWARMKAPPFFFMPYFGSGLLGFGGAGKLQPVSVGDVARAFVDALEKRRTVGEVYLLAGPDVLTWPQLHRSCAQAIVGRRRLTLPVPIWYAKLLSSTPGVRAMLPFNRDQVMMSQEDNTADLSKFIEHFGWQPRGFEESLRTYASAL